MGAAGAGRGVGGGEGGWGAEGAGGRELGAGGHFLSLWICREWHVDCTPSFTVYTSCMCTIVVGGAECLLCAGHWTSVDSWSVARGAPIPGPGAAGC